MPRGRRRGNNEGKVNKETFFGLGMDDYEAGRLPLLPETASTDSHKNDYYEGYEMRQDTTDTYPNKGQWGKGS
jgi:hypothetical protein